MANPLRVLTNDYKDCKLIKLDSRDPRNPLIVMQEGYAPTDPAPRMRMFFLQKDGLWIDEFSRSTLTDSDSGDIIFESTSDALKVLSGLYGKALTRQLPVTDGDIQAYLSRIKGGSPEDLLRQFLARYRAAKKPA